MSSPGEPDDLLARSRSALLDAFDALHEHRDSVVVIGAQAIYLRTESAPVAVAEATKDSDLAVDPRTLNDDPLIEAAMVRGGFHRDLMKNPGAWLNAAGVPVDLMVPEALAGGGRKSARGARIPPHHKHATRRARGLEAALVDNDWMTVASLDRADQRSYEMRVAGSAALLVAKAHKIGDRAEDSRRLVDKDAHDIYRLLLVIPTEVFAGHIGRLLEDDLAGETTMQAVDFLREHFAAGPTATGSMMAGRTEEGVGEPETVALQTSILASELVGSLGLW
ncbi:MAG: hypothetical protein F4Z58_05345 [Acidimicrobiaceae bacterium]|nr:hypothetical protein [Acidimicrobiaceae bacterium]MYD05969.1 hypothetical protein [Acidimicrobiaceae bacterium]MYI58634.1 hypothetical protein [Acidimicrobiaceae bacterium]